MSENKAAIFLDRDGVINCPVLNPATNQYEAPQNENDFKLFPSVIESLKKLLNLGYKLFLVSNQPDHAKGKTTYENLVLVHKKMHSIFVENDIKFTEYYYCYHHPNGVIPKYSIVCECRKPGNFFLKQAALQYGLNMPASWMIGDSDVDIFCGQSLGLKTVMINVKESAHRSGQSRPDYSVNNYRKQLKL